MTRYRSLLILACSLTALLSSAYSLPEAALKNNNYYAPDTSPTPADASKRPSEVESGGSSDLLALAELDVVSAVEELKLASAGGMNDCHSTAHKIGSLAYSSGSSSLSKIVAAGINTCLGGVMHGALEEFAKTSTEAEFARDIKTVCDDVVESYKGSCTHGAGHAISVRIPEDHRSAVQSCMLFGDEMLSSNCAAGVLMAYIDDRTDKSQYKALRGRPSDVCAVFSGSPERECWRKAFKLMSGSSVQEVFDECLKSPDPADCARYVGVRMVSEYARPDIRVAMEKAYSECGKSSRSADCRRGVVWSAANESRARGVTKAEYVSLCQNYSTVVGCLEEESSVFFD